MLRTKKAFGLLVPALLATAVGVAAAGPAQAGNPHFIASHTYAQLQGNNLVVHFKEAGLPAGSVETIRASADATTTYHCINRGGHNPSAANKRTTTSEVSESGVFRAQRNGNVSGSLTLRPPTGDDIGFSCPPGQRLTLVAVSYDNVLIEDLTSGASLFLGGPFTP